jgi:hypothetical protein
MNHQRLLSYHRNEGAVAHSDECSNHTLIPDPCEGFKFKLGFQQAHKGKGRAQNCSPPIPEYLMFSACPSSRYISEATSLLCKDRNELKRHSWPAALSDVYSVSDPFSEIFGLFESLNLPVI